mgnify:FL=1
MIMISNGFLLLFGPADLSNFYASMKFVQI